MMEKLEEKQTTPPDIVVTVARLASAVVYHASMERGSGEGRMALGVAKGITGGPVLFLGDKEDTKKITEGCEVFPLAETLKSPGYQRTVGKLLSKAAHSLLLIALEKMLEPQAPCDCPKCKAIREKVEEAGKELEATVVALKEKEGGHGG